MYRNSYAFYNNCLFGIWFTMFSDFFKVMKNYYKTLKYELGTIMLTSKEGKTCTQKKCSIGQTIFPHIVSLIVKMFNVFALSNSTYRLIEGFKQQ